MGETTARYFRDKLAMRVRARNAGILVPDFVHVAERRARSRSSPSAVPAPWVLKPRSQAAAIGIQRLEHAPTSSGRRSRRSAIGASFFLLEQFVPGDVFHVDSLVWERELLFARGAAVRHAADERRARRRHLHDAHARAATRPRRAARAR